MGSLDAKGIDVARILTDAHAAGVGVDQTVAAVTTAAVAAPVSAPAASAPPSAPRPAVTTAAAGPAAASGPHSVPGTVNVPAVPAARPGPAKDPWAPPPAPAAAPGPAREKKPVSTDARRSYEPLTEGLEVPKDLDLADRSGALEQFGVSPAVHSRIVGVVKDYVADRPASLLLSARHRPLLAARMARMEEAGVPLREHVARLGRDTSWEAGPASGLAGRLVRATHHALITPLGEPLPAGPRVSPGAARSRSATISGPAPGRQAPAEAAVPAHRQAAAPGKGAGRGR
ncbi:hypothetical protein OG239_02990 [Streptomyces sp. NBC_00868]|uniref:hypothetical protein n=1 Tax=Streptomyces sp. NBC_00868 TaxID=2903683 RepID=UPI0038704E65|nr:hypothetical protein OG239_02990 [Streptomyces sp. NBC_00868]